jgi:Cysteine-rich CPXCG
MIEETIVHCPSCGEAVALAVDTSAGDEQEYVEDCAVCCRPMDVFVRCRPGTLVSISISAA